MEKSCRKCASKATLKPIFNLVNNPKQPLHVRNSFEKAYQKALNKLTLFFHLNPVPCNGQNYQKSKGPGTSDQSLFRLQNKLREIPLLVMYYLTEFDNVT